MTTEEMFKEMLSRLDIVQIQFGLMKNPESIQRRTVFLTIEHTDTYEEITKKVNESYQQFKSQTETNLYDKLNKMYMDRCLAYTR